MFIDLSNAQGNPNKIIDEQIGKYVRLTNEKPKFIELSNLVSEKVDLDVVLLSSGLDDSFEALKELNEVAPILGNPPNVIRRVRDKKIFFRELDELGILHPKTTIVNDIEEAKDVATKIGYPIVIKPTDGFSGIGIRKVFNEKK